MPDEILKAELLDQPNILKEEYIKLLNDKDVLFNWGKPQLEALYATKIGVWLVNRLQAQLRVKALQLKIEKLNGALNSQEPVDLIKIELDVASILAEAEARIMLDAAKIESAKQMLSHLHTPERSGELRKLYRELAKQLHPDVNNNLTQEQIKLWHQGKEAYDNGDLEKLKAMRIVYEKELTQAANIQNELTEEQISLQVSVLKEGIKILQDEVTAIRSLFPFAIEANIKDDEWVDAEVTKLKEELERLNLYEEEITLQYKQLVAHL